MIVTTARISATEEIEIIDARRPDRSSDAPSEIWSSPLPGTRRRFWGGIVFYAFLAVWLVSQVVVVFTT